MEPRRDTKQFAAIFAGKPRQHTAGIRQKAQFEMAARPRNQFELHITRRNGGLFAVCRVREDTGQIAADVDL